MGGILRSRKVVNFTRARKRKQRRRKRRKTPVSRGGKCPRGRKALHLSLIHIYPESCFSEPFFDDEGVVNKEYRNIIFDRGVFRSPLASKTDAKKYDIPVTGSAVSSYDGVPQTGISQVRVRSSGKTIKELTKGEGCVYIVMCSGGDTTPDGNFATPVQVAFLLSLIHIYIASNFVTVLSKELVGALPYVVTIIVLIITSILNSKETQPPASLGLNYFREER